MTEKHTHKLKRLKYKSGNTIFFCTLPDCTFKINQALALGKRSLCWRCGEPFIMTEYSLRLVKPHCENCHKSKVPWVYEPNPTEISAANDVKEMVGVMEKDKKELSLAETISQILKVKQEGTDEDI